MARLINGLRTSDLIGPRIPIVKETLDRPRPAARLGDSYGVCARTHTRVFALVEGLSRRHCRLPTCRRGTCLCLPTFPSGFQSLYGPNRPLPHALPAIGSPRRAVIGSVIESNTATIAAGIFNITDYCLSYRLSLSLSPSVHCFATRREQFAVNQAECIDVGLSPCYADRSKIIAFPCREWKRDYLPFPRLA